MPSRRLPKRVRCMMKRLLMTALFAGLPLASASADTVFVGNVFIDFVSGVTKCTSTFTVNDTARVLYRPRGALLGNGGNSHLAFVTTRSSYVMLVQGNDFQANINYAASGVGGKGTLISKAGGITVWQQNPASVGAGSPTVSIRGRFANFFGVTGCFVEIRGNLVNR